MLISNRTTQILQNFACINQSLHIRSGGILRTMDASGSLLAKAVIEENFTREVKVYDLNRLLVALKFDSKDTDPYVSDLTLLENSGIQVKAGRTKFFIPEASLRVMKRLPPDEDVPLVGVVSEFDLHPEDFRTLQRLRTSLVSDIRDIKFTKAGDKCEVVFTDKDGTHSGDASHVLDTSSYDLYPPDPPEHDSDFSVAIPYVCFDAMMPSGYKVTVSNEAMQFEANNLTYWIRVQRRW
jgi:hypothetical protein